MLARLLEPLFTPEALGWLLFMVLAALLIGIVRGCRAIAAVLIRAREARRRGHAQHIARRREWL